MDEKVKSAFAMINNVVQCEIEQLEEGDLSDQCIAIEIQSALDILIKHFE
jgi:hypothetical protein